MDADADAQARAEVRVGGGIEGALQGDGAGDGVAGGVEDEHEAVAARLHDAPRWAATRSRIRELWRRTIASQRRSPTRSLSSVEPSMSLNTIVIDPS